MDDLELQTVGIVEECRVVAREIRVLLRLVLDLDVLRPHPRRAFVDPRARFRLEGEVVEADAIAVVGVGLRLRLAETDRRPRAAEVPDRLAALPFDLADPVEAERAEQPGVEGQAARHRGNDEIDVMNAA